MFGAWLIGYLIFSCITVVVIGAVASKPRPIPAPPPITADCQESAGELGTVVFYNRERGYGFIAPDHGPRVYVHWTALNRSGLSRLHEKQRVGFVANFVKSEHRYPTVVSVCGDQ